MTNRIPSQKWKDRFDRFDKAEPYGFLKFRHPSQLKWTDKHSVWGFLFGPFFYFFKGLHKKGLLIFAAVFLYGSLLDLLAHFLGITINNKIYALPGEVFCALFANYDVYRFHTRNETMWPALKIFESWFKVAIVAGLSLSLLLVCEFKLEPDINELMGETVSGKWLNDADSLFLELGLTGASQHLRINQDDFAVKITKADINTVVLKNMSPSGAGDFIFELVWDSAKENFRLKWIKGKGKDVLLDYDEAAEK